MMRTYQVVLAKSYIITIRAENEENALRYSQFFTGDIPDLSDIKHREEYNFEIEDIDCKTNEALDVEEINE